MPFGAAFANSLGLHIFNNSNLPNVGDATGLLAAATVGLCYLALHTAITGDDPADTQATNECTYTGYARQSKARATGAGGLTVAGNVVTIAELVSFGACTAGTENATHVTLGFAAAGAGLIYLYGILPAPIVIAPGINPSLTAGMTITLKAVV
ncbi:MAG: hypothetical protein A2Y61_00635 [Chloroflexi bacterium RBG_13_60_13]|nr:MAG: hypothetical protein A2Y61_00635 [Chloroflexi bacterium RBG_13_60_13]